MGDSLPDVDGCRCSTTGGNGFDGDECCGRTGGSDDKGEIGFGGVPKDLMLNDCYGHV